MDEQTREELTLWACATALNALVKQLETVHADLGYQGVWVNALIHHGAYNGPTYTEQLAKAKETLKALNCFD